MRNLKLRLELLKITLQLGRSEMSPPLFESNALSVDCLSDEVFEVQRTNLVSHWRHRDGYMEWEKRGGERWCQDFGETTWMGVCGRWRGWQVNSGVEPGLWKEGVVQCAVGAYGIWGHHSFNWYLSGLLALGTVQAAGDTLSEVTMVPCPKGACGLSQEDRKNYNQV